MKIGTRYLPPLWFASMRFASAASLSWVVAMVLKRQRIPARHEWPIVLGVGILQMGLFTALVTMALHFVMPGRASLIAYATSIWVVPGAAIVLKQRLAPEQKLATASGYVGIAMVVLPSLRHADTHAFIGFALLGIASLSWAANIIQIKSAKRVELDIGLLPWQTLVAAVPLSIAAFAFEGSPRFLSNVHSWYVIAYTGPLATALTFLIVLRMTQKLSPVTVSVCMLGVPMVGILLSAAAFHERLSADLVAGLSLVALGLVIPALSSRRRRGTFGTAQAHH
ncbi:DMT family transporter [Paraburkholderia tropica]|uniref:DMT family transporter n=1 Tax=Paraburkholderia tropica TaxID=92647 RepID=UPI003D2853D8